MKILTNIISVVKHLFLFFPHQFSNGYSFCYKFSETVNSSTHSTNVYWVTNMSQALWDFFFLWETVMNKTTLLILSSWTLESSKKNRNEIINQPSMVERMLFIQARTSGEGGISLVEKLCLFTKISW